MMNKGFFTEKEGKSKTHPEGKILSCAACGLYQHAIHPKMEAFGKNKKGIMNIGGLISKEEDKRGKPWVGKSGQFLKKIYKKAGIDLYEDCVNIHAVNCHAQIQGNKQLPNQIACCRQSVLKAIEMYHPQIIVLFGDQALQSIIGNRWKKDLGLIDKWRGFQIPDRDFKLWICPTFHPVDVMDEGKEKHEVFLNDLKGVLNLHNRPLMKLVKPVVNVITDLEKLPTFVKRIKASQIAFDYETTGLKPQGEGHKIICASVSYAANAAFVFLMPKKKKKCEPFIRVLKDKTIGKMAHNMKYEDTWTKEILKTNIKNWMWDSMLAAHILDNRSGITGLKFQTYVNFGIIDYASEITPYLSSGNDKDGNSLNTIEEMLKSPELTKKLLYYCALDSIYQYRLAELQMKKMDYKFLPF